MSMLPMGEKPFIPKDFGMNNEQTSIISEKIEQNQISTYKNPITQLIASWLGWSFEINVNGKDVSIDKDSFSNFLKEAPNDSKVTLQFKTEMENLFKAFININSENETLKSENEKLKKEMDSLHQQLSRVHTNKIIETKPEEKKPVEITIGSEFQKRINHFSRYNDIPCKVSIAMDLDKDRVILFAGGTDSLNRGESAAYRGVMIEGAELDWDDDNFKYILKIPEKYAADTDWIKSKMS